MRAKFKVSSEKVQTFQTQVAGLLLRNMKLAESLDQSKKQIVQFKSENELVKLALSNAREEFDEKVQSARLAAARADALELLVLDLRSDQKTLENLNNNLVKKSNDQEMIIMQKTGELIEKTTKLRQVE